MTGSLASLNLFCYVMGLIEKLRPRFITVFEYYFFWIIERIDWGLSWCNEGSLLLRGSLFLWDLDVRADCVLFQSVLQILVYYNKGLDSKKKIIGWWLISNDFSQWVIRNSEEQIFRNYFIFLTYWENTLNYRDFLSKMYRFSTPKGQIRADNLGYLEWDAFDGFPKNWK